ncbi:Peptidyl-prolyl cis-trans isomerase cyp18 [Candidatus Brocadiaceae bacterium B188]|nr:peptidyl-prolyl cis-trans isomerase [Candidatus Brocadia sapporoensis]QQR67977.1 MAG: peptidyl-prolyl cis-trans isomerase [Candidatus Brocadia sp.]RZV58083.1 MAG: peptidyl-prolyl cis-trans isomerase [Candidatus Brocadia sp. BROELEC01]TWU52838.1 Peptidyl-prolyl cis-trans isomerase cyp18 [Candidatus Brocadiaceae bacterium B188]
MKKIIGILVIILFYFTQLVWANSSNLRVRLETNKGTIVLDLDQKAAPKTVANFLCYVSNGFYNDTIFHRVIKDFMIQGGGFTSDMHQKSTQAPIENEADNGLSNLRGTIAMARTMDPHSATAQFFINTADNTFLDHKGKNSQGWGYCVFGKVVEGMNVVDAIENLPTITKSGFEDVPSSPVIIKRANLEKISLTK